MSTDTTIRLEDGTEISGAQPVVIVGANGSGKTRQSRTIRLDSGQPDFINALRNTRVSPKITSLSPEDAKQNLTNTRNTTRSKHWEIAGDFDWLLALLVAEDGAAAVEFRRAVRRGEPEPQTISTLEELQAIWEQVFPGRTLDLHEHKPEVTSGSGDDAVTYNAETMSDGERAALYVAATVLGSESNVLIIDEPEIHLHQMLAAKLWDALEAARPDKRFVYVTHDVQFGLSREGATFVVAHPKSGLRLLDLDTSPLPASVLEPVLGVASFSFHAKRIVVCEGEGASLDSRFYSSWFKSPGTAVKAVGSCDSVLQVIATLKRPDLFYIDSVVGIIDRDARPEEFLTALPPEVQPLTVHEVESLYALPSVVEAVSTHLGQSFDPAAYLEAMRSSIQESESNKVVVERWKRAMEPRLEATLSSVGAKPDLDAVSGSIGSLLDPANWSYSPKGLFDDERTRVSQAFAGAADELLAVFGGKARLPVAASTVGMGAGAYVDLVNEALSKAKPELAELESRLEVAFKSHLPAR